MSVLDIETFVPDADPVDVHTIVENDLENVHVGVKTVYDMVFESEIFESPIDLNLPNMSPIELPKLMWHHMELPPKKVKCTNTGHTFIYSGKWHQERPYISGGPLLSNYVFSQFHFHWGINDMEGSEHTVSGCKQPLEMHMIFFKSSYLTQENALKKKDGVCVIVYLFKLQDETNEKFKILTDASYVIRTPDSSTRLANLPLSEFIKPITDDYFLYLGSVKTTTSSHHILWFVSREPVGICHEQIEMFRNLLGTNSEPLVRNFREVQPINGRPVYHVNPSTNLTGTLLLPVKKIDIKISQRPQQLNKNARSSKEYVAPTIFRASVPGAHELFKPKIPIRITYTKSNVYASFKRVPTKEKNAE